MRDAVAYIKYGKSVGEGALQGSKRGNVAIASAVIFGVFGLFLMSAFLLLVMGKVRDTMTVNSSEYNATELGITTISGGLLFAGVLVTIGIAVAVMIYVRMLVGGWMGGGGPR